MVSRMVIGMDIGTDSADLSIYEVTLLQIVGQIIAWLAVQLKVQL